MLSRARRASVRVSVAKEPVVGVRWSGFSDEAVAVFVVDQLLPGN
jgi:hypothetical protein